MYSDYLSINKNFQSSINLELDLDNEEKIREYIPTTDICDVIKRYVNTALGKEKEYATTLVGPYGKGKSFILLVICFLLGKNKDSAVWSELVNKIKAVDLELFELLLSIKEKGIKLLPIVINSNYDNVTQSFQLALNDALQREGHGNILPKSAYSVCIDLINKWESDPKIKGEVLSRCQEFKSVSLIDIKKGLKSYSPVAYEQFKSLYDCINIGLEFNPLISNDIVKTYKDVCESLSKFGYSGMFIIFDEFSKFIESTSINLMRDLKLIQDFAELSVRSSNKKQIHLCCVAHKSISLYKPSSKTGVNSDSFKTVEGRFNEIRFNRSLEENYQIISGALIKNDSFYEMCEKYISSNRSFYDECINANFIDVSTSEKTLFRGCFPLNPYTAYSLIKLSELVAQNERTLFTFISDTDEDSFNTFIHSYDSGLFNVDKIYDYFNDLLQKDSDATIRNIWYRCESLLTRCESLLDKRIIKVLAIITMVNDASVLPADEKTICLSLSEDIKLISSTVKKLIDRHFIRKNLLNNTLSFALSNSKKIDEEVEYLSKVKFKNLDIGNVLSDVNERNFILPHKYNEENKITRFFRVKFLDEAQFMRLKSFNVLFENTYCDGLIINLLSRSLNEEQIQAKVNEINDRRVVVCVPSKEIPDSLSAYAMRYTCLKGMKEQGTYDETSEAELSLLIDEAETDLRTMLAELFDQKSYAAVEKDPKGFNFTLSKLLESIYTKKIIINNELINKRTVSTQYQKAVNHVMDYYINHSENVFGQTSPERSIKIALFDDPSEEILSVIESLKNGIIESGGSRVSVLELIKKYQSAPYGIREGVTPLLLAKAISELQDNVILRFQTKEIELDANNIVKACSNDKYTIAFSKRSQKQQRYLDSILRSFRVTKTGDFRQDTILAAESLKKYYAGMPQIIRTCSSKNNFLSLSDAYLKLKDIYLSFNINPYESVFENTLSALGTEDFDKAYELLKNEVKSYKELLSTYKEHLLAVVKKVWSIRDGDSVKTVLNLWISKTIQQDKTPILTEIEKRLLTVISELTFDDALAIEDLCGAIVGRRIEDWSEDNAITFSQEIQKAKEAIENCLYANITDEPTAIEENELSMMAELLKNSLESVIEEYSDSVTPNEKIAILDTLIKRILK